MNTQSSPEIPDLFELGSYLQKLERAGHLGPADFLLQYAADDLDERLASILRNFDIVADLGTPLPLFSSRLATAPNCLEFQHVLPAQLPLHSDQPLPLKSGHFALIISAMVLHAVNDLPGYLIQIRRALRPDGLFMACIPGGRTLHELRHVLQIAESEITEGVSPRVFPFADVRDFGTLLQRAGFTLPVTDNETLTVRYRDMFALMQDLRAMAATNILGARLRQPTYRRVFERAAKLYQEQFSDADGRIRATFELIWVSGWAAHESQQKPLKPGSAKSRLADVLLEIEKVRKDDI